MVDWQEEFRKAEEDVEEGKEAYQLSPKAKRFLGVAFALLIILYILVDPRVYNVLAGLFESSEVEGNAFRAGNKTIIFQDDTYGELVDVFRENQEAEFKTCLRGSVQGNTYVVEEVFQPEMHQRHVFRVVSDPCPEGTIIDLHSHPYQRCVASQTDLRGLESMKQRNPHVLLAVMCTEERISFYG